MIQEGATIFVCETYHDNDAGIFATLQAAVRCAQNRSFPAVDEIHQLELRGDRFVNVRVYKPDGSLDLHKTDFYVSRDADSAARTERR